jgi:predicted nucleic acid-binding protein
MLIAATALAAGWSLATLNTGEFGRVAGLRLVPVGPPAPD